MPSFAAISTDLTADGLGVGFPPPGQNASDRIARFLPPASLSGGYELSWKVESSSADSGASVKTIVAPELS
jgi:hypothetical protein